MGQYSEGTVSTTAGSSLITGSGVEEWLSYLSPGDMIRIGTGVTYYEIASIPADDNLYLTTNFPLTLSNQTYEVISDFSPNRGYPLANQGDLHFADLFSKAMKMIDADLAGALVFLGRVEDMDLDAAPSSGVTVGDKYIVAVGVAGGDLWFGHEGELAEYTGTSDDPWDFTAAEDGNWVYSADDGKTYLYADGLWNLWTPVIEAYNGIWAEHFNGVLEVTIAENVLIFQKSMFCPVDRQFTRLELTGVDGINALASGDTIFTLSDTDYVQGGSPQRIDLTVANDEAQGYATGVVNISGGNRVYLIIRQILGAHMGANLLAYFT